MKCIYSLLMSENIVFICLGTDHRLSLTLHCKKTDLSLKATTKIIFFTMHFDYVSLVHKSLYQHLILLCNELKFLTTPNTLIKLKTRVPTIYKC